MMVQLSSSESRSADDNSLMSSQSDSSEDYEIDLEDGDADQQAA